jgi:hypothetical protein
MMQYDASQAWELANIQGASFTTSHDPRKTKRQPDDFSRSTACIKHVFFIYV